MKQVTKASDINVERYARLLVMAMSVEDLIDFAVAYQLEAIRGTNENDLVEEYNEFCEEFNNG